MESYKLLLDYILDFEFDRTPEGINVLMFKRGNNPQKNYGDDGIGI